LLIRAALTVDLICVGPRSVFAAELANGVLQPLPLDLGVHWRSTLLTRPEAYLTPLVSHIVTLFQRAAKNI
jgi:DNA-binding transcriptional LysR family regulator